MAMETANRTFGADNDHCILVNQEYPLLCCEGMVFGSAMSAKSTTDAQLDVSGRPKYRLVKAGIYDLCH